MTELILASASPQRRAILAQLGVSFTAVVSGAEELSDGPAAELALENAYRKAAAVAARPQHVHAGVLGVDTVVEFGPRVLGKPADAAQAREMLTALAGRRHTVISGVCLIEGGRQRTAAARTSVQFRTVDATLLDWYIETGEWRHRAGGYAIQGRGTALVSGIEGDYSNVVGLPVPMLLELAPWLLCGA